MIINITSTSIEHDYNVNLFNDEIIEHLYIKMVDIQLTAIEIKTVEMIWLKI